jgi:hypothetical protein
LLNRPWATGLPDLVKVVGPLLVVTQLDEICRASGNPFARFAACYTTARYFPGRCEAYQLARSATGNAFEGDLLAKLNQNCEATNRRLISLFRSGAPVPQEFYGSSQTPPQRRETMRVYSSAMDPEVRLAACELAATMPDTRDIPGCVVPSIR